MAIGMNQIQMGDETIQLPQAAVPNRVAPYYATQPGAGGGQRNQLIDQLREIQSSASEMLQQARKQYEYDVWYAQNHLPEKEVTRAIQAAGQKYQHIATTVASELASVRSRADSIMQAQAKEQDARQLTPEKLQSALEKASAEARAATNRQMAMYYGAQLDENGNPVPGQKGYKKAIPGFVEPQDVSTNRVLGAAYNMFFGDDTLVPASESEAQRKAGTGTGIRYKQYNEKEAEEMYNRKLAENHAAAAYKILTPYITSPQQGEAIKELIRRATGAAVPRTPAEAAVQQSDLQRTSSRDAAVRERFQREGLAQPPEFSTPQDAKAIEQMRGEAIAEGNRVGRRALGLTDAATNQAMFISKVKREGGNIYDYIRVDKSTGQPVIQPRPGIVEPLDKSLLGKYVDPAVIAGSKFVDPTYLQDIMSKTASAKTAKEAEAAIPGLNQAIGSEVARYGRATEAQRQSPFYQPTPQLPQERSTEPPISMSAIQDPMFGNIPAWENGVWNTQPSPMPTMPEYSEYGIPNNPEQAIQYGLDYNDPNDPYNW